MMASRGLAECDSVVVLSPHLDDAVLSCGALLAERDRRGLESTVLTVFDGAPEPPLSEAAQRLHARCGLDDDAVAARLAEDDAALAVVGCRTIRLAMPEALYRRDPSGRPRHAEIDDGTPAQEPDLVRAVVERLHDLPPLGRADLVLAPLSIGDHIDHQIVAAAVRRLSGSSPVLWYEDIPYLVTDRGARWQEGLRPSGPRTVHFDGAVWATKLAAIDCYRSQHGILWKHPDRWRTDLTASVLDTYGSPAERYWRHTRPAWV